MMAALGARGVRSQGSARSAADRRLTDAAGLYAAPLDRRGQATASRQHSPATAAGARANRAAASGHRTAAGAEEVLPRFPAGQVIVASDRPATGAGLVRPEPGAAREGGRDDETEDGERRRERHKHLRQVAAEAQRQPAAARRRSPAARGWRGTATAGARRLARRNRAPCRGRTRRRTGRPRADSACRRRAWRDRCRTATARPAGTARR